MMDLAYSSFGDYFLCQCNCRGAAVIMADHMNHPCAPYSLEHLLRLCQRVSKRLLAKDDLLCLCGSERDRQVRIAGRTDIDDVDVFPGNNLLPGRRIFLPPKLVTCLFYGLFRAATNDLHHRFHRSVKELIHLAPGIAMCPAHELVPDHRYIQFLFHGGESRIFWSLCQALLVPPKDLAAAPRHRRPARLALGFGRKTMAIVRIDANDSTL